MYVRSHVTGERTSAHEHWHSNKYNSTSICTNMYMHVHIPSWFREPFNLLKNIQHDNVHVSLSHKYLHSAAQQWTLVMCYCSQAVPQQWHELWRGHQEWAANGWSTCQLQLHSVACHCQCCTLLCISMGHTWRMKEHLRWRNTHWDNVRWEDEMEAERQEDDTCNIRLYVYSTHTSNTSHTTLNKWGSSVCVRMYSVIIMFHQSLHNRIGY